MGDTKHPDCLEAGYKRSKVEFCFFALSLWERVGVRA
jgi:hypothetical protein